ncbi:glycosyltransferase family 4 protein [Falsihalocynthiibacter sp. S25ZX9]|uniref:glycosyltransferase family 4 protein n=1 Tax=Falsihalocynthiibacter sp. S25ZX9 TaxID=3240870 RepID=UPI0035100D9A
MNDMRPAADIAREHLASAKALRSHFWPAVSKRHRKRLGVFPYPLKNPFLPLLYPSMSAEIVALPSLKRGIRLAKLGHIDALHIQFEDQFARRTRFEAKRSPEKAAQEFIELLGEYIARGGRLAWTLHDAESAYENNFSNHLHQIRSFLAENAHVVHVFNSAGAEHAVSVLKTPPERVVMIPHPSYFGAYGTAPAPAPPPTLRRFLSFGTIRPFKGVEQFLEVLGQADVDGSFGKLVVAGEYSEAKSPDLKALIPSNRHCELRYGMVNDQDVAALFAETDFTVVNYRRVLTSGIAALSMTMGKPIIGVDRGGLKEAVPTENHSLLYNPNDPNGLARVIERACAMSAADHIMLQNKCRDFAQGIHPLTQSRKLEEAFIAHGIL